MNGINIINHIKGGLGLKDTRPTENTLVMTCHSPTERIAHFFEGLTQAIEQDECSLSFSGESEAQLILTIHCPHLNNTPHTIISARTTLPGLDATRTYLRKNHYEVSHVEYIQQIRRPSYWYGNYDHMESVVHRYFDELNQRHQVESMLDMKNYRPDVHGTFVQYPAPWGPDRVDMRFGILDNEYNYDYTGSNVDIYIIDTGVRVNHTEFQGRANFLINTASDNIEADCAGHGTHVASLAAGRNYGTAKGATIWAVKVLDCSGNGDTFTVLTGIAAVIEHSKTRTGRRAVASMSLGGDFSVTINNAVLSLMSNNISAVVAAGNEYTNACDYSPSVLGGSSHVIVVGASTILDARPPWSNYGSCVTITAPGAEIIGASHLSDSGTKVLSGTSMATPFVSGVVALMLQQNTTLSVAQIKTILTNWATPSIIKGASIEGGGKNLLYSLITVNQQPPLIIKPTPTPPPTLVTIPLNDATSIYRITPLCVMLFIFSYIIL